ncbi:cytochrome c peroxidase [Lewinella aquimaris]|uniref:Cytochrome c peroxidase n=1 Tax=Neolewinella aquimaris TaxID=1835722 RepID=A0A840ED87_9BACT|nr:cytochrome c peroxidase [Neolewinella aquimaris]MBB4078906.1 cytochrome c peroxidase [Neolewinella aquimaris]
MVRQYFIFGFLSLLAVVGCTEDPVDNAIIDDQAITGPSAPTPYALEVPAYFPAPIVDPENPITEEGIELGRHIFYDRDILSSDGSMSCASCHKQELAFTDGLNRSLGIRQLEGGRSAMSLVNLAFNPSGFNWDGSSPKLWEQAIHPVEDMLELDNDWAEVLRKLREHDDYPARFRAAFGIDRKEEITRELTVKAIAQFERTIISADSKFDRVVYQNTDFFTEAEQLGADSLFFVENVPPGTLHPGCGHCHNAPNFGDNKFKNNGIEDVASLDDFVDKGLGGVNGNRFDNGKFRTPTLRNIALTAPYMHDGRFKTLEEVLDHYASGGHNLENEDPNITGFTLTEREKEALLAFLNTLTDESLLTDERFSAPR